MSMAMAREFFNALGIKRIPSEAEDRWRAVGAMIDTHQKQRAMDETAQRDMKAMG